jgi:hypothetical protein
MTTTTIRSVPRGLPKAAIYLDDLFEVERILTEAFSKLPKPRSVSFEYQVNSELKMTTHDDLIKHGGETSSFALLVISEGLVFSSRSVVSLYGGLNPSIDFPYELGDSAWPLYAQVQQIFEARTSRLKKVVAQTSMPTFYGLYGAMGALGLLVIPGFVTYVLRHKVNPAILLLIPLYALIYAPVWILVRTDRKKAKIYFRHRRDEEKTRQSARKEWVDKVVLVILGAIAGVIGTLITRLLIGSH